jgi:hypothetical protein
LKSNIHTNFFDNAGGKTKENKEMLKAETMKHSDRLPSDMTDWNTTLPKVV